MLPAHVAAARCAGVNPAGGHGVSPVTTSRNAIMKRIVAGAAAFTLILGWAAASAQTPPSPPAQGGAAAIESGISKNPGLGQDKPKEQTSVAESNAVGSLGEKADQASMPPAMAKDCIKNPGECSEPLTTGTTQPPGMPEQSK